MEETTISCLSSLIYLENLFCIDRSYLLLGRSRISGKIISYFSIFSVIVAYTYDCVFDMNIDEKMFQSILTLEILLLAIAAKYEYFYVAVNRLDEKCRVEKSYSAILKRRAEAETLLSIASVIIDVVGMYILGAKILSAFLFTIMFAAHEAETVFYSLLIEAMNMRLLKLNENTHHVGSRMYRHVLMASNQMNLEFTLRVLMMLLIVLFTTVSYSSCLLLTYSDRGLNLSVYLLWRELKSLYCLYRLCRSFSDSETICHQLAFQLAKKLALDPAFDKVKHPQAHGMLKRWYQTLLRHPPRYVQGSVLAIGLCTPLHLLDLSVNYVLIIVQIYVAYK